jgi:general secretion pathway protein D
LSDDFFERIGVDFDFSIDDKTNNPATNNPFTRAEINTRVSTNQRQKPSMVVGLQPDGFTSNLDIPFTQGGFTATTPAFGGFDANTAAKFGFAILSDIDAFFFLQAAQGDSRTNTLTAIKQTLFNGQFATINDTTQRPFVVSVVPVVGDFAAAQQPVIAVLPEGTQMSVQATVSPDRRFVRMTWMPSFTQIGDVQTFTFEGSRTTTNNDSTTTDNVGNTIETTEEDTQSVTAGTTVQLPEFSQLSVSTTVSVPDGGTILLGGFKRLSEGRTERGVPILSKIPYINRLFRNVGIGRETESIMLMVTPRIIIQEEFEDDLGVTSTN